MAQINKLTGRDYHLFNYYGDPDAEYDYCRDGLHCRDGSGNG